MNNCVNCPYNNRKGIADLISTDRKKIVIVYSKVSSSDIANQSFFNKYWFKLVRANLKRLGLPHNDEEVGFVPLVKCYTNGKPKKKVYELCGSDTIDRVAKMNPDVVLTFGLKAAKFMLPDVSGLAMKYINGSGRELSGKLKGTGLFTFDYFIKMKRNPDLFKNFTHQLRRVKEYLDNGEFTRPTETRWAVVDNKIKHNKVLKLIDDIDWNNGKIALDIETTGLKYYLGEILCVGITVDEKGTTFVYPVENIEWINDFSEFTDIKWYWHNGQFDIQWLKDRNIFYSLDGDTMLAHYTLDETKGTQNLNNLATTFLGATPYKGKADKWIKASNLGDAPKEVQYERVAIDSNYTYQLIDKFEPAIKNDDGLSFVYNQLLLKGAKAMADIEYYGMPGNKDKLIEVWAYMENEYRDLLKDIDKLSSEYWNPEQYKKETGAKTAPDTFNPNSPKQYCWLLYDKIGAKPRESTDSVAWGNIKHLKDKVPIVGKIKKADKLKKSISTYLQNIYDIMDEDGRVHGSFNLAVAATGRLSSSDPNLQNITKRSKLGKQIRRYFLTDPGKCIIATDVHSCESRVMASESKDPTMLSVFNNNGDLHNKTAEGIFGEDFTKKDRQKSKRVNFGIPYGISAYGLAKPFDVPEGESQRWLDEWGNTYPGVINWLTKKGEKAYKNGVLKTPFGRQRRFGIRDGKHKNRIIRQGQNYVIQSPSSDIVLLAAIRMHTQNMLEPYDGHIIALIHDDISIEAPNDPEKIKEIVKIVHREIRKVGQEFLNDNIDISCDSEIGYDWSEMYQVYDGRKDLQVFGYETEDEDGNDYYKKNPKRVEKVIELLNEKYGRG